MVASACILLACLAVAAAFGLQDRRARHRLQRCQDRADRLQRIAGLSALDLRETALRLHGRVGSLRGSGDAVHAPAMAALVERCRTLADDLSAAALASTPPVLHEEPLDLMQCAREAAETVAAAMAPGRRHMRLPAPRPLTGEAGGPAAEIWADRRAVRQVLGRVLAEAALNTGEDDSVSLSLTEDSGHLVLAVADEGRGLGGPAAADADPARVRRDSRGIGASLALARALMEAHGGRLEIVAARGTGSRVSLLFPAARRRGMMSI